MFYNITCSYLRVFHFLEARLNLELVLKEYYRAGGRNCNNWKIYEHQVLRVKGWSSRGDIIMAVLEAMAYYSP